MHVTKTMWHECSLWKMWALKDTFPALQIQFIYNLQIEFIYFIHYSESLILVLFIKDDRKQSGLECDRFKPTSMKVQWLFILPTVPTTSCFKHSRKPLNINDDRTAKWPFAKHCHKNTTDQLLIVSAVSIKFYQCCYCFPKIYSKSFLLIELQLKLNKT